MRSAIILVEARGQVVHCREDSAVNLVQAAWLARELVRNGVDVRMGLIVDAGQSIEEYSILCHSRNELDRFVRDISTAKDARIARYAVVNEARSRLPFTYDATDGVFKIEHRLFFSPLLARVTGTNSELMNTLRAVAHPMFDVSRLDELETLISSHNGMPYLDLDLAIARRGVEIIAGDAFDSIDLGSVSRPDDDPSRWFYETAGRAMIERDLASKESGNRGEYFQDRLIGVFASITPNGEEWPYFNSPTSCRVEHGKIRLIARDRFNILGIKASERMTFQRFRELLDLQTLGSPERLLAIKYPEAARIIGTTVVEEAKELAECGPVHVVFIDGIGGWNPTTAGLIDSELQTTLGSKVTYSRITARDMYQELPPCAGGLLPIIDALAKKPASLFETEHVAERLLRSIIDGP